MSRGPHPAAVAATTPEARRGRSLLDRLAVRLARAAAPIARLVFRLPPRLREPVLQFTYRRGYAAFNRRDWELNTIGVHPGQFVYRASPEQFLAPDAKTEYHGVDGYLEALDLWLGGPTAIHISGIADVIDAGDGVVLAIFPAVVAGERSGVEFEQRIAEVHEWEDGWRVRQTIFWDPNEALRSVGLEPEAQ